MTLLVFHLFQYYLLFGVARQFTLSVLVSVQQTHLFQNVDIQPSRMFMYLFVVLLIFHLFKRYLLFGVARRHRFISI